MPTISSEITSVDTLQIRPVSEAFAQGQLFMHTTTEQSIPTTDLWGTSPLNWALMALCIVLLLISMRRFISVLPSIWNTLFRWREIVSIEGNMRLSRERNSVALASIFICSLCISRLGLFHNKFLSALSPGFQTLAIIGILCAYLLARWIAGAVTPTGKIRFDTAKISGHGGANFFILETFFLAIGITILAISSSCLPHIKTAAYIFTGLLFTVNLIRRYQIITQDCGFFTAISYLCSVEILPAVLLVISLVYL